MLLKIATLSGTIYLIQIIAFFLEKKFGEKKGVFFSAFLQGMLSSTALTLSNAKKSQTHFSHYYYHMLLLSTFTGIFASLVELLGIIWINSSLLGMKLLSLVPIYIFLLIVIAYHRYHLKEFKDELPRQVEFPAVSGAFKLAIILFGFIYITSLLKEKMGSSGTLIISFLGGLFETHGIALAQVSLMTSGDLSINLAYQNILISVMAGFLSKTILTVFLVRNKYSLSLSVTYVALALVTLIIWVI